MSQHQGPESGDLYQQLKSAAERTYGESRADELDEQLTHLAAMMAGVADQALALTEAPLEPLPRLDRSGQ